MGRKCIPTSVRAHGLGDASGEYRTLERTPGFFRARRDGVVDPRHPLLVEGCYWRCTACHHLRGRL